LLYRHRDQTLFLDKFAERKFDIMGIVGNCPLRRKRLGRIGRKFLPPPDKQISAPCLPAHKSIFAGTRNLAYYGLDDETNATKKRTNTKKERARRTVKTKRNKHALGRRTKRAKLLANHNPPPMNKRRTETPLKVL
jgi:hypothetical protein